MNDARTALPARSTARRLARPATRRRLRRQIASGLLLTTASAGLLVGGSMVPAHAALLGGDGAVCGLTDGGVLSVLAPVTGVVAGCTTTEAPTPEPAPTAEPTSDGSRVAPEPVVPAGVVEPPVITPTPEPVASPTPVAPTFDAPSAPAPEPTPAGGAPAAPAPVAAPTAPAPTAEPTPTPATTPTEEPISVAEGSGTPEPSRSTGDDAETDTSLVAVSPLPSGDDLSSARQAFGIGLLVAGVALVGLGGVGTMRRRQLARVTYAPARAANAYNNTPWAGAGGR